eukprot:120930-Prymnesium_polylepis.1
MSVPTTYGRSVVQRTSPRSHTICNDAPNLQPQVGEEIGRVAPDMRAVARLHVEQWSPGLAALVEAIDPIDDVRPLSRLRLEDHVPPVAEIRGRVDTHGVGPSRLSYRPSRVGVSKCCATISHEANMGPFRDTAPAPWKSDAATEANLSKAYVTLLLKWPCCCSNVGSPEP